MKITREDILNMKPARCIIAQCECGVVYDEDGKQPSLNREQISRNLTALMAPSCLGCGSRNWIRRYKDNGEFIMNIPNMTDIAVVRE